MDYLALIVILGLAWLGKETNWLTIRLLVGAEGIHFSEKCRLAKDYNIKPHLPPMCGYAWVLKHEHDMDGFIQEFDIAAYGIRHRMVIRDTSIIKKVARSIKPPVKRRKAMLAAYS